MLDLFKSIICKSFRGGSSRGLLLISFFLIILSLSSFATLTWFGNGLPINATIINYFPTTINNITNNISNNYYTTNNITNDYGNSSWNQTFADSLYYSILNPSQFLNWAQVNNGTFALQQDITPDIILSNANMIYINESYPQQTNFTKTCLNNDCSVYHQISKVGKKVYVGVWG